MSEEEVYRIVIDPKDHRDVPYAWVTDCPSYLITKTGSWRTLRPIVDNDKCIKCGMCWKFCPDVSIHVKDEGAVVDYEFCKGCGICAYECPVDAIVMEKEDDYV